MSAIVIGELDLRDLPKPNPAQIEFNDMIERRTSILEYSRFYHKYNILINTDNSWYYFNKELKQWEKYMNNVHIIGIVSSYFSDLFMTYDKERPFLLEKASEEMDEEKGPILIPYPCSPDPGDIKGYKDHFKKMSEIDKENKKLTKEYEKRLKEKRKKNNHLNSIQNKFGSRKFAFGVAKHLYSWRGLSAIDTFERHPELLAFKNGVAWNLKENKLVEITQDMRLILNTGYDFPERKEEDINLVLKFLEEITPDVDRLLKSLCICLYGENINQLMNIFTGVVSNGKNLLLNLLMKVMGGYSETLDIDQLTEKVKGIDKTKLSNCKYKRLILSVIPEHEGTEEQVKLRSTTINLLTGRDKFPVRIPYKKIASIIKIIGIINLLCNEVPETINFNFSTECCYNIETFDFSLLTPIPPFQKPRDVNIIGENKSFRNGLLFLLIDKWFETKGIINNNIKNIDEYKLRHKYKTI